MIREVSSKSVEGQFSLGVDLGGTNLRVAAYRSGKQVAELISLPTRLSQGRERVIRDLKDGVHALRSRRFRSRRILGADVSAVSSNSSMDADPLCKRSRMIFSSRSSVFTDMEFCRSQEKCRCVFSGVFRHNRARAEPGRPPARSRSLDCR